MSAVSEKYLLIFYVPSAHTTSCIQAIFKTGAGTWPSGLYAETCFITRGTGQFRPTAGANPNIGSVGELEKVEEDKVEMVCTGKECVQTAVEAMKRAHPYEEVAYFVFKSEL